MTGSNVKCTRLASKPGHPAFAFVNLMLVGLWVVLAK
jgi:hypothetical protein